MGWAVGGSGLPVWECLKPQIYLLGLTHCSLSRNLQGNQDLAIFHSQAPSLATHCLRDKIQTAHLSPQALPLQTPLPPGATLSCSSHAGHRFLLQATLLPTPGPCPCCSVCLGCSLHALSPPLSANALLLRSG